MSSSKRTPELSEGKAFLIYHYNNIIMDLNYNGETAQLSLRTWQISPANNIPDIAINAIGEIYAFANLFIWKNINVRHLLGDMWDKYEYFNISLVYFNKARANLAEGSGADSVNRVALITMAGLNWSGNNGYILRRPNDRRVAVVGTTNWLAHTDGGNAIPLFSQSNAIFRKSEEITDIEVELLYPVNNQNYNVTNFRNIIEKATARMGHFHFVFTIYPVLPALKIKRPLYTQQSASLVLRTYDISQLSIPTNNTNNQIGFITANNGYITWRNINLRALMGNSFYEKYNKFNICLKFYSQREQGGAMPTSHRVASLFMSGLQWSNQGYDVTTKSNSQFACIGITNTFFTGQQPNSVAGYSFNSLTFRKGGDITDINIEFKFPFNQNASGFTEKSNVMLGHHTFCFQITGCEGYENF
jgi:hypothetical protein